MARSTYIYTVTHSSQGVIAAFTVKHELCSWLRHLTVSIPETMSHILAEYQVHRLRDGGGGETVLLDIAELLTPPSLGIRAPAP